MTQRKAYDLNSDGVLRTRQKASCYVGDWASLTVHSIWTANKKLNALQYHFNISIEAQ